MNVKESHIVTGMSRDSSVSRQNPNLVYDALNIRITTKDGRNSVLSVTNERGTKQVTITSGSIEGTPIGSAILGDYIVIFTHKDTDYKDHIYKCKFTNDSVAVTTVFEGDAGFDLAHPLETLPIFETENIQKVYWVDGIHQPRFINIIRDNAETNSDKLNFSREIALAHNPIDVTKNNGGGSFPTGTIQYCFSYYDKYGQETRLVDISPMFYLSPRTRGADATTIVQCSFSIKLEGLDTSFDYVRLYSIVRIQENATPQCRIVGDYPIASTLTINDDGIIGRTIEATALYFIGGEEITATTIAQKDNTLFLGGIKLLRPNLIDLKDGSYNPANLQNVSGALATISNENHFYSKSSTINTNIPEVSPRYYSYKPDNNRSSYYIKRFRYGESYRLGIIAQYKNGQWSDPLWLEDATNTIVPLCGSSYKTGRFSATLKSELVSLLMQNDYKRVAPVVIYPKQNERKSSIQGVLCPTVYTKKDRTDNAPYAQSSWFFRWGSQYNNDLDNNKILGNSLDPSGEIQCMDYAGSSSDENYFQIDEKLYTFHSPDIECSDYPESVDLSNLNLQLIGRINTQNSRVIDHYLTIETVGIDTENSKVLSIRRTPPEKSKETFCVPLYCDGLLKNDPDEVETKDSSIVLGWIVYPWHRSGSLNNQTPLTTKQRQSGYSIRTASLKRNITARYWYGCAEYKNSLSFDSRTIGTPVLWNSDQLSAIKVENSSKDASYVYYGNVDKVITAKEYRVAHGWWCNIDNNGTDDLTTHSAVERSEKAINYGYNRISSATSLLNWWQFNVLNSDNASDIKYPATLMKTSDPISMKYKSTPHLVLASANTIPALEDSPETGQNPKFHLAQLKSKDANIGMPSTLEDTLNKNWVRCGDSVILSTGGTTVQYMQGDCYFQRYDCLKTYAFTDEDQNSVIEVLSTMIESYINLDFRYDNNRGGGNNTFISPRNFNLFNHLAYEQSGNFFTYRSINPSELHTNKFSNVVTWSLEKHAGEDVDNWTSIDVSNTLDLDGAMGSLTKLINYNNDIYAFQSTGFSKLLFNSRVQIPTSDNIPIEITNGMKMQGKQYISTKIGCTNKWSIVETPLGLYFIDDILRTAYMFNGQLQDLSTTKGMKSWMNDSCNNSIWDVQNFGNCRAFYDKVGKDIYWIYDDIALVYSEILGQYMSFMSYGGVPLLESINEGTYAITGGVSARNHAHIRIPTVNNNVHEDTTLSFLLDSNYNKVVNLSVNWETESSNQESMLQSSPRRSASNNLAFVTLPFTGSHTMDGTENTDNNIFHLDTSSPVELYYAGDAIKKFYLKGISTVDSQETYFTEDWTFEGHTESEYYNLYGAIMPGTLFLDDNGHYWVQGGANGILIDLGTTNPALWDQLPITETGGSIFSGGENVVSYSDVDLNEPVSLNWTTNIPSGNRWVLKGKDQNGNTCYVLDGWTYQNHADIEYYDDITTHTIKTGVLFVDSFEQYKLATTGNIFRTLDVAQEPTPTEYITPSVNSLSFAQAGGHETFDISTISQDVSWEINTSQAWVTVNPSSGSGNATITVTANPNTNTYQRNAQLTIRGTGVYQGVELTISISQDAAQPTTPYLTVSPQVLGFGKLSDSKPFSISSNTSWRLSMLEPNILWVHVNENSGTGDGQITVSVDANENTDSRQATIVVTDGDSLTRTIVVAQSGNANWSQFSVSPVTLSFAGTGEPKTISLTCDFNWKIVKNVSWLEINPYYGSGSEDAQTIEVTAAPNNTTSIRQTTIELIGGGISQTITISQEAGTSNAADVIVTSTETTDTVQVTLYTCEDISSNAYTIGDLLDALREKLPEFLNAWADKPNTYSLEYKDKDYYDTLSTSLFNSNSAPLWKLNAGNYNEFFGVHEPYYLTLISNGYPTQNKIFNTVEWRDIVKDGITTKPFHTFDHIRVWTENQDTQSVRFSNSLSQDSSRQPISYNAAVSNLRKKFNVWRAQIPRDKIALNTNRARISNPWCYIKLSREDIQAERHEIMDIEVNYFM